MNLVNDHRSSSGVYSLIDPLRSSVFDWFQELIDKFEFFPIKCRVQRAADIFRSNLPSTFLGSKSALQGHPQSPLRNDFPLHSQSRPLGTKVCHSSCLIPVKTSVRSWLSYVQTKLVLFADMRSRILNWFLLCIGYLLLDSSCPPSDTRFWFKSAASAWANREFPDF